MQAKPSPKARKPEAARTVFLEGPVGSGKRALLVDRMRELLDAGQSPRSIRLIAADRQAAQRMESALRARLGPTAALPELGTYYRLALTSLLAQWPAVAAEAGIGAGRDTPTVLNYESAQHLMGLVLAPRLAAGAFEGLRIRPQALISQLLDGLNKAAIGRYPVEEVARRMGSAWIGSADRLRHYVEAEACMLEFRSRCEAAGALDLSLSLALFDRLILRRPERRATALGDTRHLLVLNLEELVPLAQDTLRDWLPDLDSALLVADRDGGHRILLGANPDGVERLADACALRRSVERPGSPDTDPCGALASLALLHFGSAGTGGAGDAEGRTGSGSAGANEGRTGSESAGNDQRRTEPVGNLAALREAAGDALLEAIEAPTRSGMIQAAADAVARRVAGGHPADQICLLTPYVDGLLRFGLSEALAERGIPLRTLRRFLPLRESVVVRSCLTLAGLATPGWPRTEPYALAEAMTTLLPNMDPVRAASLSRRLYDRESGQLSAADSLDMRSHEQLGHAALEAWSRLQSWVRAERMEGGSAQDAVGLTPKRPPSSSATAEAPPPLRLDLRLERLFEALAGWQPLEPKFRDAFAQLADSAERFSQAAPALGLGAEQVWPEFARMVEQGVVEARPRAGASADRDRERNGSVLLTTAHGYLVEDRRDRIQIWLDAASPDWLESPHQALTNPYVLARDWPEGRAWTPEWDRRLREEALARVLAGLARRAGEGVIALACRRADGGLPQEGRLWPMLAEAAGPRLRRIESSRAEA